MLAAFIMLCVNPFPDVRTQTHSPLWSQGPSHLAAFYCLCCEQNWVPFSTCLPFLLTLPPFLPSSLSFHLSSHFHPTYGKICVTLKQIISEVCVCVCVDQWANLGVASQEPSAFILWEILLIWNLVVGLNYLAREPQGFACSCLPSTEITGQATDPVFFFSWVLGTEFRYACLLWQCFTKWSSSLACKSVILKCASLWY